jgi:hypothetical protein
MGARCRPDRPQRADCIAEALLARRAVTALTVAAPSTRGMAATAAIPLIVLVLRSVRFRGSGPACRIGCIALQNAQIRHGVGHAEAIPAADA